VGMIVMGVFLIVISGGGFCGEGREDGGRMV